MKIIQSIKLSIDVANTIFQFAAFDWDRKTAIRVVVASSALLLATATIAIIESHEKDGEEN